MANIFVEERLRGGRRERKMETATPGGKKKNLREPERATERGRIVEGKERG